MAVTVQKLRAVVEADTRQAERRLEAFDREVRRKVAATGDAEIRVDWDLNDQALRRQAQVAAEKAEAGLAIDLPFDLDDEHLRAQVAAAAAKAEAGQDVKLDLTLDTSGLRAKVKAATEYGEAGQKIEVPVHVDTGLAQQALDGLTRRLAATRNETNNFRSQIAAIGFPLVASGAALAASAISAIGTAAVAAASNIATLGGLLGALPGLAAAGAQGVGVLALAFNGIGDAVKAMNNAQARSAQTALQTATAQRSAAQTIVTAQRSVRDAQLSLADAQRSARMAEEGLTQARRDARLALIDLRFEVERNALSQERAALNVQEALQRLRKVQADPRATRLERAEAALTYKEALQSLREITERRRRSQQELAEANRRGIAGSEQVRSANLRIADAHRAVQRAAQNVTDAQANLANAMKAAEERTSKVPSALQAVQQKMDALSPAAQRFARVLFSYQPLIRRLQATAAAGLFPGLESAFGRLKVLFPDVNRIVGQTARMFGGLARQAAAMVTSGPWRRDLATIGSQNVVVLRRGGQAALNLADALRNVIIAAGPLVDWISRLVLGWSQHIKASAEAGRQTGTLRKYFQDVQQTTGQWLRILGNVLVTLRNISRAARPLGDDLVRSLERVTAKWAEFTGSTRGQNSLKQFFDQARPALREMALLIRDLAAAFLQLSQDRGLAPLIAQIRTELLPALVRLVQIMSGAAPIFVRTLALVLDVLTSIIRTVPGLDRLVGAFAGMAVAIRAAKLVSTATGLTAIARGAIGAVDPLKRFVGGLRGAEGASATFAGKVGGAFRGIGGAIKTGVQGATAGLASLGRAAWGAAANFGRAMAALAASAARSMAALAATLARAVAAMARTLVLAARGLLVAMGPTGWLIAGIVAAVVLIILNWDKVKQFLGAAWKWIVNAAKLTAGKLVEWARKGYLGPIPWIIANWTRVKTWLTTTWNALWNAAKTLWSAIRNAIMTPIRAALAALRVIWAGFVGWLRTLWNNHWAAAKRIWSGIKRAILDPIGAARDALKGIWNGIVTTARTVWGKMPGVIKGPIRTAIGLINSLYGGVRSIAGRFGLKLPEFKLPIPRRTGGPIPGTGPNRDTVPIMGAPGEWVIQRPAVQALTRAFGGAVLPALNQAHRWATRRRDRFDVAGDRGGMGINMGQPFRHPERGEGIALHFQKGGLLPRITGLVGRVQNWIRAQDPKPYRWGAAGPNSFDCSGLVGAVYGQLTGRGGGNGQRYFTTSNFPAGTGFVRGKGTFTVGVRRPGGGTGHMALNLAGLGGEARSTATGIFTGNAARSVTSFPEQWYLPAIGGNFVDTGGPGLWAMVTQLIGKILDPIRKRIAGLAGGGLLMGRVAAAGARKLWDAAVGWVRDRAGALFGSGGVGPGPLGRGGLSPAEAWIIQRESGGRTTADNPTSTAFGLGQLLLANRQRYAAILGVSPNTTDYNAQLQMFRMYVRDRYGTAEAAKAFWETHGWYGQGGILPRTGPFFGHSGEGVLNRQAMAHIGPAGLAAMNRGEFGGVYIAQGGIVVNVPEGTRDPRGFGRNVGRGIAEELHRLQATGWRR